MLPGQLKVLQENDSEDSGGDGGKIKRERCTVNFGSAPVAGTMKRCWKKIMQQFSSSEIAQLFLQTEFQSCFQINEGKQVFMKAQNCTP